MEAAVFPLGFLKPRVSVPRKVSRCPLSLRLIFEVSQGFHFEAGTFSRTPVTRRILIRIPQETKRTTQQGNTETLEFHGNAAFNPSTLVSTASASNPNIGSVESRFVQFELCPGCADLNVRNSNSW